MSDLFVRGHGPKPADIMFIGERPGRDEAKWGRPFQGKSGKEMDRYLLAEGIDRAQCFVTNVCQDYLEDNPDPEQWEIDRDSPVLDSELADVNPKYIGLIGRFAARRFLGDVDMESSHGLPFTTNFYPMSSWGPKEFSPVLMPIYHPSFGLHNPQNTPLIADDFHQFGRLVRGELDLGPRVDLYHNPDYRLLHNSLPLFLVDSPIYIDTEGSRKDPWGLSFTQTPGQSFVILTENKDLLRRLDRTIRDLGLLVVLHNAMHDLPVLWALGVDVDLGRLRDTMIRAHHLCIEPQGLKPLARRHANMEMQSYQEMVHEAGYKKALDYLERAYELLTT